MVDLAGDQGNYRRTRKHPIGFMACVLMSLAPYRLKYYWQRIIGKYAVEVYLTTV